MKIRDTAALLVVLSLPISSPATAQLTAQPSSTATPVLVDLSKIHIDNFGQVNRNYYRGAQPKGSDYEALARLGIKTLVNLTSDDAETDEEENAKKAGMGYFQIPMTTRVPPTAAKLEQFLRIVNDPVSQPVYVHCVGGRHRTGVMTAVYRMTQDGWSADRAFKEMKQYKFGADFLHQEFKEFVYGFPTQLAHAATAPAAAAATK